METRTQAHSKQAAKLRFSRSTCEEDLIFPFFFCSTFPKRWDSQSPNRHQTDQRRERKTTKRCLFRKQTCRCFRCTLYFLGKLLRDTIFVLKVTMKRDLTVYALRTWAKLCSIWLFSSRSPGTFHLPKMALFIIVTWIIVTNKNPNRRWKKTISVTWFGKRARA